MRRAYTSLAIGLVLAVIAVVMLYSYVRSLSGPTEPAVSIALADIVVAKQNLPFGTKIAREMLGTAQWPQDSIPEGAFTSIDAVFEGGSGSGDRIALTMV